MNDTEPIPVVSPPRSSLRSALRRGASARLATIAIALASVAFSFAVFFVWWSHREIAMLRSEVREARLAATVATRAADRAELAARSAQSALASVPQPDSQAAAPADSESDSP